MFSVDDLDFSLEEDFDIEKEKMCVPIEQHVVPSLTVADERCRKNVFRCPSKPDERQSHRITSKISNDSPVRELKRHSVGTNQVTSRQCVQRKFPGPAGLLPDMPPRSFNDSSATMEHVEDQSPNKKMDAILCSQASENAFSEPPFKKLKEDFDIKKDSPLSIYTVEWVRKNAASKGLKGRKIPFLAVILQSVDCSSADPLLSLRDITGELSGTLHREVWQEMGEQLRPGAAIVLKQVGVLSTGVSRRQVLLNITMNNIVTIYSPSDEEGVVVKAVQATTTADLVRSIADWQARLQNSPARSPDLFSSRLSHPVQSLFQSVRTTPQQMNRRNSMNVNGKSVITSTTKEVIPAKANNSQISNFDLFLNDDDLIDIENSLKNGSTEKSYELSPKVCKVPTDSFQRPAFEPIVSSNKQQKTDGFRTPQTTHTKNFKICSQATLSQAEFLLVDEVLSGVDLDDFE